MAGTPSKNGARIATIVVVVPMLILAYFISPLFLPRWRWENMRNWEDLAQKFGKSKEQLQKTYQIVARYAPRADRDPVPWQIIHSDPLYDPENDEPHHMIRATLIGDRSGEPISQLRLGSNNYRDIFFKGPAWRFPPGAFGFNKFRPVFVYDAANFDKVELREAFTWEGEMKETSIWTNDDEDVEDGFKKPSTPIE